jgi:hypothetical protein
MKTRIFLAALGFLAFAATSSAQRAYDTPKQAADALIAAAAKNDTKTLIAILGPGSEKLVNSGDAVRDKQDLAHFVERARQKTAIEYDLADPDVAILVVGSDDWPTPIPIVKGAGGQWTFDAKSGVREVLARRIGGNELDAIALLRGYVDAQQEYALEVHDGSGIRQYAQKFLSSPGKHDGLSWWNADKTPGGPMGDEIAKALAEGYTDKTKPYNGYFFRILTAQGPAAPRGARSYIYDGAMIGGFAAVAWPATYDVTGIQTFLVNQDGIVYQKDLGPETATLAPQIKAYDPDKTWTVTEDAMDLDVDSGN